MKAAGFDYVCPSSLDEALEALGKGDGAVALAGGQSLMPALNLRERRAPVLVDLRRVPDLRGVELHDGVLHVGAMEPMWDLERNPLVREHAPLLHDALLTVGAPAIRSRATLGGSVAWADPTSQLPGTLIALDAAVVTSTRRLPVDGLFLGPYRTALAPGEVVVGLELPSSARAGGARCALRQVRRTSITWPVAGCAAHLRVRDGVVELARIGLFGAGPTPVAASEAAALLEGRTPDEDLVARAADAAVAGLQPLGDARASADYRMMVLPVLVRRALATALDGGAR